MSVQIETMKLTQTLSVLALILTLLFIKECKSIIYSKMTNAVCETFNKSWVTFDDCRLRAVSRNITTLNIRLHILHPANNINVRLEYQKKANGYKPWLWDYTIDACAFMRQKKHPVFKLFYNILKNFSTINHTCPYVGTQIIKDLQYTYTNMKVPLPSGEYLLILTWIFDKKPQFVTKVYYLFRRDVIKD